MKNFFFCLSLAVVGILAFGFALSKRSDCFSPSFARARPELIPEYRFSATSQVQGILKQSFTFLGSGNQSYAFESADQKWVLKLVKFHCLTTHDPYQLIPRIGPLKNLREERDKERKRKLDRVFEGFYIAYTCDKENCGLLYYHLPDSNDLPHETILQDKAGKKHVLDLNHYVFALQRKAVPSGEFLRKVLKKGDVEEAKNLLAKLFAMFKMELKNGIYDADHNVIHNTGFAGSLPMRIDVGKMTLKEINAEKELEKIENERIIPWVQTNFPEYVNDLIQKKH